MSSITLALSKGRIFEETLPLLALALVIGIVLDDAIVDVVSDNGNIEFNLGPKADGTLPDFEVERLEAMGRWLEVNGEMRQQGDLNQLIWKVPEMIAYLSSLFELRPGDLIMSGTPAGVGPVSRGDVLHGEVAGIGTLDTRVV